ncbi:MAG: YhfC family glutamic-type intramembrane protease [Paludibacteraceae bacterium]|nr:YhfC family glutamic-type intramembrane protease [Paludibacteraceae bacterium]
MEILYMILAALTPVVVLLFYIFFKDREQPEPAKWLIKAFFFGCLSVIVSLCITTPLSLFWSIDSDSLTGITDAFVYAFGMAAIPEEFAKFLMLWLLLRKNPYFDEQFDGIVYAVCVGMGFAGVENILYLAEGLSDGSWVGIGISRAIFSIPGHFFFAVLMGYYYSLCHFGIKEGFLNRAMVLVAPILAHGIYDAILFSIRVNEMLSVILMLLFLVFFIRLAKKGKHKIKSLAGK